MAPSRRKRAPGRSGVVLVDKPVGPTSRTVVDEVARRLELASAGHCGTLDPLASGLLVIVAGSATRVQDLFMGGDKTYEALVVLGASSRTDDAEGPIVTIDATVPSDVGVIDSALDRFVGAIRQVPPSRSAVHVDGKRAHRLDRAGKPVDLAPRSVVVHSIERLSLDGDHLALRITCGPGTYIRSIARDLGSALGCGAYLGALRRTASGKWNVGRARAMDDLVASDVLRLEELLVDHPRIDVDRAFIPQLLQGRPLRGDAVRDDALIWCGERIVGRAAALGDGVFRMRRLIHDPSSSMLPP